MPMRLFRAAHSGQRQGSVGHSTDAAKLWGVLHSFWPQQLTHCGLAVEGREERHVSNAIRAHDWRELPSALGETLWRAGQSTRVSRYRSSAYNGRASQLRRQTTDTLALVAQPSSEGRSGWTLRARGLPLPTLSCACVFNFYRGITCTCMHVTP